MNKNISILVLFLCLVLNKYSVFSQGNTCQQATPFCTAVGTPFVYPNVANGSVAQTGPNYGCLTQRPDPSWFYIKTSAAGVMTFSLSQTVNANGTGGGLDVDFIAYGPFLSPTGNCGNLTAGNTVGCSYSPASTETLSINSPGAGSYYLIMITNFTGVTSPPGTPGYIAITQTGGPGTDCSIACPLNNFTLVGTNNNTNANIPNGSTVNCVDPFVIQPPTLPLTNPNSDILTPCIRVSYSPFTANISSNGTVRAYEGGTQAWATNCPTCAATVGGTVAVAGNDFATYYTQVDPAQQHDFSFCKGAGAIGTTTITLENCWTGSVIAGPTVWTGGAASPASCFTLTAPANTSVGTGTFAIAPATGSVGIVDLNWGLLYVDPSYLPGGQTYTVTYTFQGPPNCAPVNGTYTFSVPAVQSINAITSQTVCSGSTVAATNFTTSPSGGAYNWANNNTSVGVVATGSTNIGSYTAPTVTATTVGIFTVTPTLSGCIGTARNFSITINPRPTPSISSTSTLCLGSSLTFTGSGASTYTWAGTAGNGLSGSTGTNITATPTATGSITYTTTATSAAGCTNTAVRTITVNPIPTANAGTSTSLTCSTRTIGLSGSGGGTYSWSGPGIISGGATATPSVNVAGTYSLVVTSTAGCTSTVSTVSVPQNTTAPTAGASNATILNCTTTTAGLTGTGGGTYSWSGPGTITNGTTANPTVNAPGNFSVTVTAANGCTAVATTSVTQNITPPTAGASNATILNCTTTTAGLTGTGGGTYSWSGPGTITNGTTANPTVNTPGNFSVTVTAANGCTAVATTSVTQNITPPTAGASNATTLNCTTTTAGLTGTGGGTYLWSGPGTITNGTTANPTVNAAGNFTVRVTAANGCTATAVTTVFQNTTAPTAGASNATILNCTTTTAGLTGTGGGTYSWSGPGTITNGTTANPTVNTPGNFSVTVTAANGCTAVATTSVTQNITPPTAGASNATILNCTTTTAGLTGTGGGTYSWSGPGTITNGTTANPTVNTPGNFSVTVTAANGCTAIATTSVTQNITPPTTTASTTGSITCVTSTVNLASSLAGMNYTWTAPGGSSISGSPNLQNAVGQGLGTYTLNVLNTANGCTYTTTIAAIQNTTAPTSVNAGTNQTLICGVATVTLSGSATPGTATANWLGGVTSPTNFTTTTGSAGIYTLQAINPATGCFITSTVQVTSSVGSPSATANAVTNSITCTNSIVAIGITPTSTGPFTYQWPSAGISGPTNNATATATLAGVYNVTLTNSPGNNCSIQISITVPTNTTPVVASITTPATITCAVPTLTLNASPTGASYTYTWSGSSALTNGSTQNPEITSGGTYSVSITNTVNGCVGNANVSVASNTVSPTVNIAAPSVTTTCANPTVTIVASASPSTGVTYSWTSPTSGSLSQSNISNPVASGTGIFTVVVTNTASGCSSSLTQNTVSVVADAGVPNVTLSNNTASITCSNPTPSVTITTTTSPVSYSWSPTGGIVTGSETTASPSFSAAGSYSVVVTNTNSGCATSIASNVVTVSLDNTVPVITLSSSVNNGTITCTNTLVTISPTVTPSTNLTYTWSPSGVTSTSINDATFTTAGVYTLAVTNTVTGCVTSLTNTANTFTIIADNATPSFTLGTANSVTTTCAAPNATLSGSSSSDPNAVYTWTTPSSATVVGNPIFASTAGIYSVVVTNTINGCSTSAVTPATVEVVADAGIPVVTLSANSVSITCADPTPSVAITTTANPVSYSWTPTSGIVPGTETTSNPLFNAAGSYSAVVTNTATGCATGFSSNVVDVVLDNSAPVITLSSATNDGTITCTNTLVTISPTVTPSANLTYTWSPSGVTSTSINDATFTSAGVYTLAVTNTLTGCVTSLTNTANTFTVYSDNSAITASASVTSTNTIIGCGAGNSSVTFSSTTTSTNSIITWFPGSITSPTLDVTSAGVYSLQVVDAVSGCSVTTSFTVDGSTTPPQGVNAGTSANIACGASTTELNGSSTSTTGVTYSWSGPSASSISQGGSTLTPTVTEAGDYTLTVTDDLTGCSSTSTITVTQALATASITANPMTGTSPLDVSFTGSGAGNPNFSWDFANGSTSSAQNPNNVFLTGTYVVTLTTISGTCTATATVQIVVEDGFTLEIPNVFTPNEDGANDVFTIKSTGVKEIALQIFNRWGEKLYEFTGAKASWDGLAPNSVKVPEGTYFYFVKATGFDGTEVEKHGTVNLFR